ncbi:MAG: hypothetical protein KDE08_11360 [Rhodobacteraceae bacterium]|nr:hypothetical protein [Paracoccaceae bacterium]
MSHSQKTRPSNNLHCFKGAGIPYWRAKASGLRPSNETRATPQGHVFDFARDFDGLAINVGGIAHPRVADIGGQILIRFFSTGQSVEAGRCGAWWLDFDALDVLNKWALQSGNSLSKAAQLLLVVPLEWGDCGQMIVAQVDSPMRAWVGTGKEVGFFHGKSTSPDAARRVGTSIYAPPPGTNIRQIFIPGERSLLESCIRKISSHKIGRDGRLQPSLARPY